MSALDQNVESPLLQEHDCDVILPLTKAETNTDVLGTRGAMRRSENIQRSKDIS